MRVTRGSTNLREPHYDTSSTRLLARPDVQKHGGSHGSSAAVSPSFGPVLRFDYRFCVFLALSGCPAEGTWGARGLTEQAQLGWTCVCFCILVWPCRDLAKRKPTPTHVSATETAEPHQRAATETPRKRTKEPFSKTQKRRAPLSHCKSWQVWVQPATWSPSLQPNVVHQRSPELRVHGEPHAKKQAARAHCVQQAKQETPRGEADGLPASPGHSSMERQSPG